jgi:hypothetical protein
MSKVVIQGHASGTGDFTIAAPNSDTDRTLTLPDEAGEVLVTDGTTLVVDNTNDRVGIGTSSPSAKLHVSNNQGGGVGRILLDANVSSGYETSLNVTDTGFEITSKSNSRPIIFNAGTTPAEHMRIDGSGRVTTPNQPSFHAHANFNLNHGSSPTTYVWNLTQHNIGNHYNTTTGRFTVPVAGRYFFSVEALQNVGASSYYTRVYLFKNGALYIDGLNSALLQGNYGKVHINAVVEAAANDYFETVFVSNNGAAYVYATYSYFSGHLLG